MSLLQPGLEAFVAVVKHSTVHGAAKEIGLTQTGVTQRIRALERQLGVSLFTRSRKGMRPTTEGEALLRYCLTVQDLEGELLSSIGCDARHASAHVNIVGPSSIMRSRIIPGAAKTIDAFEHMTFTFNLNDDEPGLRFLKSGLSQLAVLQRHEVVDELDSKLLAPETYILVAAHSWRKRQLKEIVGKERIVDFNETDEATFQFLIKHRLFDLARKERHLANNTDALAMLVAEGHGYSVLSEDFAALLINSQRLANIAPGKTLKVQFALAWYPRREMPDYFRELIRNIK
jgi:LysR family transcriptional regulator (chromosome initiation inhibitor)